MLPTLLAVEASGAVIRTVAAAIAIGVMLIAVARRLGLPAIVLLLAGGMLLGPAVLGDAAIVQPDALGDGLRVVVALAIGLILFEGGLTLDLGGYRTAPAMIKRLLTVGVLVSWGGAAAFCALLGGIELEFAVLAGSMVVVTGPTVIAPLLKRLDVNERLHGILHWEGVLIDPIGVFIAVLCFEVVVSGLSGPVAAAGLLLRIAAGLGLGVAGGAALTWSIRRRLIPDDMLSISALAMAMLVFGAAEMVRPEAGLLATTVSGFVFAITGPRQVKRIRAFKAEISELLIALLFMLLSARLEFAQFTAFGWSGVLAVLGVMLVVRPASVFLCSIGTGLSRNERLFLGWVAPRGIVAASLASLFAIAIEEQLEGSAAAEAGAFVETFVYAVIIATIVVQGLSAGFVARLLGLQREPKVGWMIVGAHALGIRLAEFLQRSGLPVVVADTNPRAVREAIRRGVPAVAADARETAIGERREWSGVGNVLALTDNEDLNIRICQNWTDAVGAEHVFRADPAGRASLEERDPDAAEEPDAGRAVWPRLPRPSLLAAELQRGQAALLELDAGDEAARRLATPIATLRGRELSFAPPDDGEVSDGEGGEDGDGGEGGEGGEGGDRGGPAGDGEVRVLALQRTAEHLLWSLRPELVLDLEPTDLRAVFDRVVQAMVRVAPRLSREAVVEELLERETAFPTLLGDGVALPHAYAEGLDGRLCAIVRIAAPGLRLGGSAAAEPGAGDAAASAAKGAPPTGDAAAADTAAGGGGTAATATEGGGAAGSDAGGEEPIRLLFCLLSPNGDPEGHLASLAEIARLVLDEDVRRGLLDAESPLEVIGLVGDRARKS